MQITYIQILGISFYFSTKMSTLCKDRDLFNYVDLAADFVYS